MCAACGSAGCQPLEHSVKVPGRTLLRVPSRISMGLRPWCPCRPRRFPSVVPGPLVVRDAALSPLRGQIMKSPARTRWRVLITAAALVAATAIPQLAAGAANAAHTPGRTDTGSAVPHYRHIAVILMTDHGFGNIIGNPHAPTINALAQQY